MVYYTSKKREKVVSMVTDRFGMKLTYVRQCLLKIYKSDHNFVFRFTMQNQTSLNIPTKF